MSRPSNVGSPLESEMEMDMDMDPLLDETFLWEPSCEYLDTAFYENAVTTTNKLVEDNIMWWMKRGSECLSLFTSIKELLTLYNAGEAHVALTDLLEKVPTFSNPPPIPKLLLHLPDATKRKTATAARKSQQPKEVYEELKESYKPFDPEIGPVSTPEENKNYTLQELRTSITESKERLEEGQNFTLIHAANMGHWLSLAFDQFQEDKKEGRVLFSTFDMWLQDLCGIKRTWGIQLRKFFEMCVKFPQLLRCRVSLSFIMKNRQQIVQYFTMEPDLSVKWAHFYNCDCGHCGPRI